MYYLTPSFFSSSHKVIKRTNSCKKKKKRRRRIRYKMGGNERYIDIYKDSLYGVSKEQINTCTFQIGYNDTNSVCSMDIHAGNQMK